MLIFRWGAQSLRSSDWRVGQKAFWNCTFTFMFQLFHKQVIDVWLLDYLLVYLQYWGFKGRYIFSKSDQVLRIFWCLWNEGMLSWQKFGPFLQSRSKKSKFSNFGHLCSPKFKKIQRFPLSLVTFRQDPSWFSNFLYQTLINYNQSFTNDYIWMLLQKILLIIVD